jgi:hypothetical protein
MCPASLAGARCAPLGANVACTQRVPLALGPGGGCASRNVVANGQGLGKVRECLFHGFLMSVRQLGARALAPGRTSVHT